jgi:glycosyltransferase involved in cell wall biosynthesis
MKVIRVTNFLNFGGVEKVLECVARFHEGPKTDLVFVALKDGGSAERVISGLGFRVILLHQDIAIPNWSLLLKLYQLFRLERPDVVHACAPEANFHAIIAARLAAIPIRIGEEIGMPGHSMLARIVFRFVYRYATTVIGVAQAVVKFLIESGEVPSSKARLVYYPLDMDFAHLVRKPDPEFFTLLTVCRLHPVKNLPALLRIIGLLKQDSRRIRLWIVGEGQERQNLEKLSVQLKLKDQVTFFGFQMELKAYLERADLVVLPSFSEGLPVSVIESMSAGVPVVVTRIGGGPEIVQDKVNGRLVDPYDDESLRSAIQDMIGLDPADRDKMVSISKDVVKQFAPRTHLTTLYKLYDYRNKTNGK